MFVPQKIVWLPGWCFWWREDELYGCGVAFNGVTFRISFEFTNWLEVNCVGAGICTQTC